MKFVKILASVILVLLLGFIAGPRVPAFRSSPQLPKLEVGLEQLVAEEQLNESRAPTRPDNQARFIWANDTLRAQTEYALVYLHGFGASQEEGDPIHEEFARRYGMNAYLARIADHGLTDQEPFLDLSADEMVKSAEHALAIGKQIGKKVILMSCSTGSTLSLYLAAEFPEDVEALIMYSPNVDVNDPNAKWLTRPWGYQIAKMVTGSEYREWNPPGDAKNYWYGKYRLNGVLSLKALIDGTMTKATFERINQPILMLYYYENENKHDRTVSIPRMKDMFQQVATPTELKRSIACATVGHHCLASRFFSKDLDLVRRETIDFAEEILQLRPID